MTTNPITSRESLDRIHRRARRQDAAVELSEAIKATILATRDDERATAAYIHAHGDHNEQLAAMTRAREAQNEAAVHMWYLFHSFVGAE